LDERVQIVGAPGSALMAAWSPLQISWHLLLWVTCVLITASGCGGSDRAKVTGTVRHQDGTPLVGALVIARSNTTGSSANGDTDGNGHFVLRTDQERDGIPPGDYYVIIVEGRRELDSPQPQTISAKYRSPSSSGLRFSVKPGEETVFDVTLDTSQVKK